VPNRARQCRTVCPTTVQHCTPLQSPGKPLHWKPALIPFRESRKRDERVEPALRRIRGYLEQLHRDGETDFESDWAVWNFAKRLERELRPVIEQEFLKDDLSDDELTDLIEELVDEKLE